MAKQAKVWNGSEWIDILSTSPSLVTTSASEPASPVAGQMYFNTTTKILYVYNASQWVPATPSDEHLAYVYFD